MKLGGLASLAQKGVLRERLCQPVCRRSEGLASEVFAVGFSLAPVTVGYSYMQDMLQLEVEQQQLCRGLPFLPVG